MSNLLLKDEYCLHCGRGLKGRGRRRGGRERGKGKEEEQRERKGIMGDCRLVTDPCKETINVIVQDSIGRVISYTALG